MKPYIMPVIMLQCSCGKNQDLGPSIKMYELKDLGCECGGTFSLTPGERHPHMNRVHEATVRRL